MDYYEIVIWYKMYLSNVTRTIVEFDIDPGLPITFSPK